ncbi:MAG: hypothetical protein JNK78_10250 [Planctomycetes bacterium]|nr:hypothetical protein [Planctomycetota bacterium]
MSDDEALVERCRRSARDLQRDLGGPDPRAARAAAVRFARLPRFANDDIEAIVRAEPSVARAEALDVIAAERGFDDWRTLVTRSLPELLAVPVHTDRMGAFVNRWFATYGEAAEDRGRDGGFLLPYRRQFFVTVADAVREIGVDPNDPDWARIGHDWVRPLDVEAHVRLCRARRDAWLAGIGR